jgi:hypothetical protein
LSQSTSSDSCSTPSVFEKWRQHFSRYRTLSNPRHPAQSQPFSDCKRLGLTLDYCCHPHKVSPTSGHPCHYRSWSRHHGIFHRCHTRRQPPRVINPTTEKSGFRRVFFTLHRCSFSVGQVVSVVLQQLDDPTCILDECRFCYLTCSICVASQRACQDHGTEYHFGVENACICCGEPRDRLFRVSAMRRRVAQHQGDEPRHTYVFECESRLSFLFVINFVIAPQAARSVIQTLLGVWLFQDVLTTYGIYSAASSYLFSR